MRVCEMATVYSTFVVWFGLLVVALCRWWLNFCSTPTLSPFLSLSTLRSSLFVHCVRSRTVLIQVVSDLSFEFERLYEGWLCIS